MSLTLSETTFRHRPEPQLGPPVGRPRRQQEPLRGDVPRQQGVLRGRDHRSQELHHRRGQKAGIQGNVDPRLREFLPDIAWPLLSKTGPPFCPFVRMGYYPVAALSLSLPPLHASLAQTFCPFLPLHFLLLLSPLSLEIARM